VQVSSHTTNACDDKWQRNITQDDLNSSVWDPNQITVRKGRQVRGPFGAERVRRLFNLVPNTLARVSVSLTFFGELVKLGHGNNGGDFIYLAVNDVQREVHWPMHGRFNDEVKILRGHVCQQENSTKPDHCHGHFYFDAVTDADGRLEVELVGERSLNSDDLTWTFANFTVEMPILQTTLTYANLSQACKLGTFLDEHNQHIERFGSVGLAVIGMWTDTITGNLMSQVLYRMSWPVRVLFPQWVTGTYLPITVWVERIAPEVTETAGAFVGTLLLFEGEAYTSEKMIPRYEQNATVWARHCLEDRGWGLKLEFKQALLSGDDDPTNITAYLHNLTDDVTGVWSEPAECLHFTFRASHPCDFCTLHVFGTVEPVRRRLVENQTRGLSAQGDELVKESGFTINARGLQAVQQDQQQSGYAVNSALIDFKGSDTPLPPTPPPLRRHVSSSSFHAVGLATLLSMSSHWLCC